MSRLQEVKKVTKEWLSENIDIPKEENISLEVLIDNRAQIVNAWYDNENTNIEDYKVILDTGMVLM